MEISIFILLRILLLLCGGKRDAISGWLATLPTSVASFRRFFRHAPTSSHLLPSNHTFTRCQFSHIALWRDVYKRDREHTVGAVFCWAPRCGNLKTAKIGEGSPVCDVATSLEEILPLSYNKCIYMARACSWQNTEGLSDDEAHIGPRWRLKAAVCMSLCIHRPNLRIVTRLVGSICQQLYRLLIMTLEIWWMGHVARAEHEKQKILNGRFGERSHSEDLEVNG